jgi:ABC-type nitrate/sulfonate/bicarbonate transport system permease component
MVGVVNAFMLPPPVDIIIALWSVILNGTLKVSFVASLRRVAVGYLMAVAIDESFGFFCGWWKAASIRFTSLSKRCGLSGR